MRKGTCVLTRAQVLCGTLPHSHIHCAVYSSPQPCDIDILIPLQQTRGQALRSDGLLQVIQAVSE